MYVIDDLAKAALRQETILTIGTFDGVHRGHQALIRQVVARARDTDRLAALITFYPHPAMAVAPQVRPDRAPLYLTTPGEKLALIESQNLDLVAMLPFTPQLASTSAQDFMEAVCTNLRAREVWVGVDFALGRNREGNVARLRELGQDLGYEVHVIPPEVVHVCMPLCLPASRPKGAQGEQAFGLGADDPLDSLPSPASLSLRSSALNDGPRYGDWRQSPLRKWSPSAALRGLPYSAAQSGHAAGGNMVISSSQIRALLREGRVEDAAQMLGRYPSVSGEVVSGAHRGRQLGFPTANLEVRPERAVPANGVYVAFAVLGTARYPAVANVGVRPSFDNGRPTVETHLLDFDEDIYGCDLVVEFVARLRDERRFDSIQDLVAQIKQDVEAARRILAGLSEGKPRTAGSPGSEPCEPGSPIPAPLCTHHSAVPAVPAGSPGERREGRTGRRSQQEAGSKPSGPACPYRYEEIEHTADRALRVWGKRLPDLFVGAARGMAHLMADLPAVHAPRRQEGGSSASPLSEPRRSVPTTEGRARQEPAGSPRNGLVATHWREIRLDGLDRETMLVKWLNELLYLTETEGVLFVEFQIQSLTDTSLVARAGGVPAEVAKAQIKAATFHDLELLQDEAGWSATLTFDA